MKYACRVCTVSISRLTEWFRGLRSSRKTAHFANIQLYEEAARNLSQCTQFVLATLVRQQGVTHLARCVTPCWRTSVANTNCVHWLKFLAASSYSCILAKWAVLRELLSPRNHSVRREIETVQTRHAYFTQPTTPQRLRPAPPAPPPPADLLARSAPTDVLARYALCPRACTRARYALCLRACIRARARACSTSFALLVEGEVLGAGRQGREPLRRRGR